jgi:hypothetical protein
VLKGGSSREHTLTDQALAKALAECHEYLASLIIADGVRASLGLIAIHHVA